MWSLLQLAVAICTASFIRDAASSTVSNVHLLASLHQQRGQSFGPVSWDGLSLFIHGERVMIFSGEFHPFRLPSPGLWLDVFQKMKAMGFGGCSFYVDWSLVEGTQGIVRTDGIFSLQQFFAAAAEAGIYLFARPGPYINAETAAGGMPGWMLRNPAILRSYNQTYLALTELYIKTISRIISEAEISKGGPVIMVQAENEYTTFPNVSLEDFPDEMNREYMAYVENQYRGAGITVPLFVNDNEVRGDFAPGSGLGAVDIYGIDAYPLYYDCATPYYWPNIRFPTNYQVLHEQQSPTTPFFIAEFQGGASAGWGGAPEEDCAVFVNDQAVRVLFKNNYSFGLKMFNIYMIYGGTNWGNLGFDGGETSYDYGASISETRHVWREKYSEMKLEANFLKASPAYLTSLSTSNATNGSLASTLDIAWTQVSDTKSKTKFYVIRHADWTSMDNTTYKFDMMTSEGNFSVPQLGGELDLYGRDSKIFVTDYDVGGVNLIYNTADIFTWTKGTQTKRILLVYGAVGETHEMALPVSIGNYRKLEGSNVQVKKVKSTNVVHWTITPDRQVLSFGVDELQVQLLWRNDAFNHWVLELPAQAPINNYTSPSKSVTIVKAGYLMRSAKISGDELQLIGDFNETTPVEVISTPSNVKRLSINGKQMQTSRSSIGNLQSKVTFRAPSVDLPSFGKMPWKYIDSLPEIQPDYDDRAWTNCRNPTTTNDQRNLTTPTSLYASDYGYHCGSLIYRGHFTANGQESNISLLTSGGTGYGHSVWLGNSFLGSWVGSGGNATYTQNFTVPDKLQRGREYILTVFIDHMGQTEEGPGTDTIKYPYGVLDYNITGHDKKDVSWKMTGNLGGEHYYDLARGPKNEGAMYAERHGYHLPNPPSTDWQESNPITKGISGPGIRFYTTKFELNIPEGYDVPMRFVFNSPEDSFNATGASNYRCQFFVNGYQFGKYVNNLGPQTTFPVPEGILNYHGMNDVALTLWAQDSTGAKIDSFSLVPYMPVMSVYPPPALAPMPSYAPRRGVC